MKFDIFRFFTDSGGEVLAGGVLGAIEAGAEVFCGAKIGEGRELR